MLPTRADTSHGFSCELCSLSREVFAFRGLASAQLLFSWVEFLFFTHLGEKFHDLTVNEGCLKSSCQLFSISSILCGLSFLLSRTERRRLQPKAGECCAAAEPLPAWCSPARVHTGLLPSVSRLGTAGNEGRERGFLATVHLYKVCVHSVSSFLCVSSAL